MKILIMNRKYGGVFGGVELMSTSILNEMTARGHECHVVSLDYSNAAMCYDLDKRVKWHRIATTTADSKATWKERWTRLKKIRSLICTNKIDLAIGFQDGAYLSLLTAALWTNTGVIAAERNAPSRFNFIKAGKFKQFTFLSFRFSKKITVQCPSYIYGYPKYLRQKIAVIPNPVFPATGNKNHKDGSSRKKIISVGRISFQKNYVTLIEAFSELSGKFPTWDMMIVGDGEDKKLLVNRIAELNLSDRIKLTGYNKNPAHYYNTGDIFCLPSRWEGFPNALAEAMTHGLACVGFAGCSGVSDLIEHEKTGVLADGNEDHKTLKVALERLMLDDNSRIKMGEAGAISIAQYAPRKVFDMWEKLFMESH